MQKTEIEYDEYHSLVYVISYLYMCQLWEYNQIYMIDDTRNGVIHRYWHSSVHILHYPLNIRLRLCVKYNIKHNVKPIIWIIEKEFISVEHKRIIIHIAYMYVYVDKLEA